MKNFGKKAKDKITGFTGVITGKCTYIYGCDQYVLTPSVDKEGKRQNGEWFDEGRIEIMDETLKTYFENKIKSKKKQTRCHQPK